MPKVFHRGVKVAPSFLTCTALAIFLCLLFSSRQLGAENADTTSSICMKYETSAVNSLLSDLNQAQALFWSFRSHQREIRYLYYEPIWENRRLAMDPLDKEKRNQGNTLDAYYTKLIQEKGVLANLEADRFLSLIKKMELPDHYLKSQLSDPVYKNCFRSATQPVIVSLEETLKLFNRIFESERDYQVEVSGKVGSTDGRYPQDTVEQPAEHKDFFQRFENDRNSKRFEDENEMLRLLESIRFFYREKLMRSNCCLKSQTSPSQDSYSSMRLS